METEIGSVDAERVRLHCPKCYSNIGVDDCGRKVIMRTPFPSGLSPPQNGVYGSFNPVLNSGEVTSLDKTGHTSLPTPSSVVVGVG